MYLNEIRFHNCAVSDNCEWPLSAIKRQVVWNSEILAKLLVSLILTFDIVQQVENSQIIVSLFTPPILFHHSWTVLTSRVLWWFWCQNTTQSLFRYFFIITKKSRVEVYKALRSSLCWEDILIPQKKNCSQDGMVGLPKFCYIAWSYKLAIPQCCIGTVQNWKTPIQYRFLITLLIKWIYYQKPRHIRTIRLNL